MDIQLDDGDATTGIFRAGAVGVLATTAAGTAYAIATPTAGVTSCQQLYVNRIDFKITRLSAGYFCLRPTGVTRKKRYAYVHAD